MSKEIPSRHEKGVVLESHILHLGLFRGNTCRGSNMNTRKGISGTKARLEEGRTISTRRKGNRMSVIKVNILCVTSRRYRLVK